MIIFFILMGIIFFISLMLFIICLSTLEIEVKNLVFNSNNTNQKLEDYLIYIKLKLLNKLTWVKIKIDNKRIKKYEKFNNKLLEKFSNFKAMALKSKKEILKRENIKCIKDLDIKLEKIDLNMKINLLDTIITSFSVALISSILSILIANIMEDCNYENCKYKISPIYNSKTQIIISLNCIINVKIVHIINIVYILFKKRGVDYDERTSNRRTYVCSND